MKKKTVVALFTVALTAGAQGRGPGGRMGFGPPPGGPAARLLGAEAGMPGRVVKNAPYSAEVVTESTQTLSDGNKIKQSGTVKVYRDSEGRTRREQAANLGALSGGESLAPMVFIHDPVAGVSMALNAKDKTGTRTAVHTDGRPGGAGPMGRGMAPHSQSGDSADQPRRGPSNADIKTESLGSRSFDGVMADGRRTTLTIPAGKMGNEQPIQVVTETWYSSELHAVVYQKRSDPRNGETVTRVSNISRAEPSRTLFDAPADYKMSEGGRRGMPGQIR